MQYSLFTIKQHIVYLLKAKNAFSVHSPFVYSLYSYILKNRKRKCKNKLTSLHSSLCEYLDDYNITTINSSTEYQEILDKISQNRNAVIISNIHTNKEFNALWQRLTNIQTHYITIDFFCLGILINCENVIYNQNYILKY